MTGQSLSNSANNRWVWWVAIACGAVILLSLALAPFNRQASGSTYNRFPDGYGAWYAFMQEQGTAIQRWQKPFAMLMEETQKSQQPTTLLQVNSSLARLNFYEEEEKWVAAGVEAPATAAPFNSNQSSDVGSVKIETRRRVSFAGMQNPSEPEPGVELIALHQEKSILGDRFGSIVVKQAIGKGELIYVVTPHLAANAYQDAPGNYKFLAQLVTQETHQLWVDEYLHGYSDLQPSTSNEGPNSAFDRTNQPNWFNYLAQTPLLPLLLQAAILLAILIFTENNRFGAPIPLTTPKIDNSQVYIEALASILQKAERSEFVLDLVGKEEQLQIQSALGLGSTQVEPQVLLDAWVQQTGRSSAELEQVLRPHWQKQPLSEAELILWMGRVGEVHRHLPDKR
jgi:Domain of unknown function (DUF4350)